ncbi:MAG TPA: hypothetical protein VMW27_24890 [Thermoanaerobaculia bacterium]|nr:hypothetical protein [Thermoanaerobaculia bacterium]
MAAEPKTPYRGSADRPSRARGEPFSFERIEYGKLCTSPSGPILPGVEAYPLIRSPGFPPAAEKLCRPRLLGIGSEMLSRSPHGTVLRGVWTEGRVLTVACRLRRRAESGEGGPGRRYWLGRYFCSPAVPPSPWTCFRALGAEPLRGITPAEAKSPGRPLSLPPAAGQKVDEQARRFLEQALVLAMSGLPVGITALEEETFFLWATALWHLLPGPLRPLLSVGWEVHPEQTQTLSLSTSTQFSPTVAVFDAHEERWTFPERVTEELPEQGQGEPRTVPFDQTHLVPGRMYMREAFRWSGGRPVLGPPDLGFLEGSDDGIRNSARPPHEVVDLGSSWCRERFRQVGLRCLDHARLRELGAWLRNGGDAAPEDLAVSTAKYFFPDAKQKVLTVGLAALAEPSSRDKGDRILWSSLLGDRGAASRIPPGGSNARARLLRALALRDLKEVFQRLAEDDPGPLADLPLEIQAHLESALEKSLETGPASLPFHRQILTRDEIPEPYQIWAIRRAAGLAVFLGTSGDREARRALESLDTLSKNPLATVFLYLLSGQAPGLGDLSWLRGLEPRDLERCRKGLLDLWEQAEVGRAARRERLIPWLRAVGPFEVASQLLEVLFKGPPTELSEAALQKLTQEIQEGGVPLSLEPVMAAIVLRWWRLFSGSFNKEYEFWKRIARHWPDEYLVGLADWLPSRDVSEIRPPREIEMDGDSLEILIRAFPQTCSKHSKQRKASDDLLARAAALLWSFCRYPRQTMPATAEAARLCASLLRHQLPENRPSPDTCTAVAVLSSRVRDEEVHWAGLWDDAAQGWQMLFLLECAPWVDFQPSVEQLSRLLRHRQELRQHLKRRGIHEGRQARFLVASWDFQGASYSEARQHWRDEFTQTPLWAAFRNLPHPRQGSLQQALEAYAGVDGDDDLGTLYVRRTRLATDYLKPYEKTLERSPDIAYRAARKVAEAVIVPILREGHLSQEQVEFLLRPRRRVPASQRRRFSLGKSLSLKFSTPAAVNPVQVNGREIVVAPWFYDLIEKVQSFDYVGELVAVATGSRPPDG